MKNTKTFFALECSRASVKLIQMARLDTEFQLISADQVLILPAQDETTIQNEWKDAIQKLTQGKDLESATCFLSINHPMTYFTQQVIPRVPAKEMTELLKWKMKDEIPFPLEEAVLDYRVFELAKSEKEFRRAVLVSATPRIAADPALKILRELGLHDFTPVYAALTVMGLPQTFETGTRQLVAVIDIGESITEISFYAKTKLAFLRKIGFGSVVLNSALMQPLTSETGRVELNREEVERIKREVNFLDVPDPSLMIGKFQISKLHALVRPELENLITELRRSFDYYTGSRGEGIERIFLTGSGSSLKGIDKFLEQELHIPTKFVNFEKDISVKCESEELAGYARLVSLVVDRAESGASLEWVRMLTKPIPIVSYQKVIVSVMLLLVLIYGGLTMQMYAIQHKTEKIKSEVFNLKPGYEFAQELRQIEDKILQIEWTARELTQNEPSWIEIFREISHVIPEGITLSSMAYDGHAILLKGALVENATDKTVAPFLQALRGVLFRTVSLVSIEKNGAQPGSLFTIRCEVT